jgi:hypothetical protein
MTHAIQPPPPIPNPRKPEWVERFTRRIQEADPTVPLASAREEAEALYEVCWGEYTPEQAADVATGLIEPADDLAHLFDNP